MKAHKLASRYVQDPAANLATEASQDAYRRFLHRFAQATGNKDIDTYTERDLIDFLASVKVASTTLRTYRGRIEAFFAWAEYAGHIKQDPARQLGRAFPARPKPVRQHHWLTEADIATVIDSCDLTDIVGRRDNIILRLGFTAGLRRSEIVSVRWSDLDLKRQALQVLGKGQKLAQVYITDQTAAALAAWRREYLAGRGDVLDVNDPIVCRIVSRNYFNGEPPVRLGDWGTPLTGDTVNRIVREVAQASGVEFSPHDMRRSFAGLVYEKVGIEGTSKALRHSNLGTTQRYLETRQDAAFQVIKGIGLAL